VEGPPCLSQERRGSSTLPLEGEGEGEDDTVEDDTVQGEVEDDTVQGEVEDDTVQGEVEDDTGCAAAGAVVVQAAQP